MFIASKYEDIYPLKMKMVFEKIAHKKLPIEKIKSLEMDILKTINYRIPTPTSLDFLKVLLKQTLQIGKPGKGRPFAQEKNDQKEKEKYTEEYRGKELMIERIAMYLIKMAAHDYELCNKRPSIHAAGSLFVALRIYEQLKKT